MSKLSDFFQKLGSDAALLEAYKADPEGVMQNYGLSDEEIAAVMSGDKEQIDSLSGDSSDTQAYLIVTNPDDSN
ncbi:hypothetical protein [Shewanella marisflavi]|uniref:Extradiol ring-cleavage dioxygenase LigAB LigA subunit domain-containing protein n=1 Tax=Shewanella marisflavi TaxID=260364 RepID=A0AAC9U1E9_9GAMM|nr:hypothetical protein [Shewanella marisflavi]ASJ97442.1 hypothetical protein CFF01_13100 [Shewanella marisflavi]